MPQRKEGSRPRILQVVSARAVYTRSPRKFIRRTSTQLQVPLFSIHKVLHKMFKFLPMKCNYYRPSKQKINHDKSVCSKLSLDSLDSDPGELKRVCFGDESKLHVYGV